jgi:hypothetical protein
MVHHTPNFWHVNGNSSYEKIGARKKKTECKPNASPTFFWIQIALIFDASLLAHLYNLYLYIYFFIWFIHVYPFSKRPGFIVWFAESRDSPVS